jgi:hypothetical protein
MPQIFLCYAREDEAQVREVYQRLNAEGFEPWMDKMDLLPGQRWRLEIPRALRASDFVLVFLSHNSVARQRGYVHREYKLALDTLEEMQEGVIHTIPIRLDDCEVPEQFHDFQSCDLFEVDGFDRLVQAIQVGLVQRRDFRFAGNKLFTANLDNEIFKGEKRYYIMIKVEIPREIIRDIAVRIKVGAREDIDKLHSYAIPGVRLYLEETPPNSLPRLPRSWYFYIDHQHGHNVDMWHSIRQFQNIAVYCDLPPETEMALFAVCV